jgi:hypothetical protein
MPHTANTNSTSDTKPHNCPCNGVCPCCPSHDASHFQLSCADPPSADSSEHADSSTRSLYQSIQQAEKQVDDLTKTISRLTSLRNRLQDAVLPSYRSRVMPISRMPDDVLLHIFELCLGDRGSSIASQGRCSSPWALSRVCHRWRSIMLSYHHIWSLLRFDSFWMPGDAKSQAYAQRCSLHLERSAFTPLCVNLSPSIPQPRSLLNKLTQTTDRWMQLHLGLVMFKEDMRPLLDRSYASLQTLSVPANPAAMEAFTCGSAPSLSSVTFTAVSGVIPILSEFPYLQLSELTLGGVGDVAKLSPSGLHQILSCCENLVHVSVTATITSSAKRSQPLPPLVLPKLKSLTFRVRDKTNTFCSFLRSLRAPSLQHLSVTPATNAILKSLYRFIQRSRCSDLTSLSISAPPYARSEPFTFLSPLLSLLPHLEQLGIHSPVDSPCPLIGQTLDALTRVNNGKGHQKCPRLAHLQIDTPGGELEVDQLQALCGMLASRSAVQRTRSGHELHKSLRTVHVCGANYHLDGLALGYDEGQRALMTTIDDWTSQRATI